MAARLFIPGSGGILGALQREHVCFGGLILFLLAQGLSLKLGDSEFSTPGEFKASERTHRRPPLRTVPVKEERAGRSAGEG